jgi:HTH-type transcriptional regulator, sugar sensing transcriptional regulator
MKNQKIITLLQDIGLSADEAAIYTSALSLGKTTVLKLSKATAIKRSTIYGIIEALKNKGLMSVELKGTKSLYVAESPEKLQVTLERKTNELKAQLPELLALYDLKSSESVIKYYVGLDAMKEVYLQTLKDISPGEDYLVITNQEKWFNLNPVFSQSYIDDRAKLNITTRLLFQDSPLSQEHKKFERNFNQQIKILPKETVLNVDTIILPNKLIVCDLTAPYMTVVIENKSIIELQKQMFNLVWNSIT